MFITFGASRAFSPAVPLPRSYSPLPQIPGNLPHSPSASTDSLATINYNNSYISIFEKYSARKGDYVSRAITLDYLRDKTIRLLTHNLLSKDKEAGDQLAKAASTYYETKFQRNMEKESFARSEAVKAFEETVSSLTASGVESYRAIEVGNKQYQETYDAIMERRRISDAIASRYRKFVKLIK